MSQMLGNYHFLIRDFSSAKEELEKSYTESTPDLLSIKKLIICYTQTDQLNDAVKISCSLLNEDADSILIKDPEKEDCPCKNLIEKLESGDLLRKSLYDLFVELGVLWLFCDDKKSLSYFEDAANLNSSDTRINQIISILKSKIKLRRS